MLQLFDSKNKAHFRVKSDHFDPISFFISLLFIQVFAKDENVFVEIFTLQK